MDNLAPVSIRPKEINVYEKFTQTDVTMETIGDGEEEMEEETSVVAEVKEPELKQEERQVEGEGLVAEWVVSWKQSSEDVSISIALGGGAEAYMYAVVGENVAWLLS